MEVGDRRRGRERETRERDRVRLFNVKQKRKKSYEGRVVWRWGEKRVKCARPPFSILARRKDASWINNSSYFSLLNGHSSNFPSSKLHSAVFFSFVLFGIFFFPLLTPPTNSRCLSIARIESLPKIRESWIKVSGGSKWQTRFTCSPALLSIPLSNFSTRRVPLK